MSRILKKKKFEDTFYLLLLAKGDQTEIQSKLESISEIDSVRIKKAEYDLVESSEKIEDTKVKNEDRQQQKSNGSNHRQVRSIRVDIERLDLLMNLVSELIIIKNTMEDLSSNNTDSGMIENMEYLSRVANELHDAVMKVRMVPIEMVFNRFQELLEI